MSKFMIPNSLKRVVYNATGVTTPAIAFPFRVFCKDSDENGFYVYVQSVVDWRDLGATVKAVGLTPTRTEKREKNGSYANDPKATESMIGEKIAKQASGITPDQRLALRSFRTTINAMIIAEDFTDDTRAELLGMVYEAYLAMDGDPDGWIEACEAAVTKEE